MKRKVRVLKNIELDYHCIVPEYAQPLFAYDLEHKTLGGLIFTKEIDPDMILEEIQERLTFDVEDEVYFYEFHADYEELTPKEYLLLNDITVDYEDKNFALFFKIDDGCRYSIGFFKDKDSFFIKTFEEMQPNIHLKDLDLIKEYIKQEGLKWDL